MASSSALCSVSKIDAAVALKIAAVNSPPAAAAASRNLP